MAPEIEAVTPNGTTLPPLNQTPGSHLIEVGDGVWVRPNRVIAAHVGVTGKTCYLILEGAPEEIWVPETIDEILATLGLAR